MVRLFMYFVSIVLLLPISSVCESNYESLQNNIKELRPQSLNQREINWRHCLIDAYNDAKKQQKPVFIWAFLGDPIEGRC